MIFTYGGYFHPDNECMVTSFSRRCKYSPRNEVVGTLVSMRVEGLIIATGPTFIGARVNELKSVYSIDGGTAALGGGGFFGGTGYVIDGPSANYVHVGINFKQEDGKAHFATGLPFEISFDAEYPTPLDMLWTYEETITQTGDGRARIALPELDNAPAIPQIVSAYTNVSIVQSGSAVGYSAYPDVNPPIFSDPTLIINPEDITLSESTPNRVGQYYQQYPVRWCYKFTMPKLRPIPSPILR